mgnify:CR=1 FL=1
MTYYERLKNTCDRNVYCSPDERTERFMQLVEADKERRLKEEYRAEIRKDQELIKYAEN